MKQFTAGSILILYSLICLSCRKETVTDVSQTSTVAADTLKYNSDWSYASHGNSDQNYAVVFPQNAINTIEITMTASQWSSIRTNMKSIYGTDFGASPAGGPPPGGPGGGSFTTTEPDYVDVQLEFSGKTWKNVGFRLKGNSTLQSAWSQGNYKLPFRLNFDKFEDKYGAITNQHFYGFEEMSFSPGYKDQSLIREKLASDVFKNAGIPCAVTAFYKVYIDIGSGLKYCGLYTGIELPDDNMIKSQFGEEKGNIYKPESNFTSFVQSVFEKKNNETAADFNDVKNFISNLNSNIRTTDPAQWRTLMGSVFNMEDYLKYLAVNNAIVNWDSYGVMTHNYYLYNHTVKRLTWIPWDHNEAFAGSPGITGSAPTGGPGGGMNAISLTMNEVSSSWPLIRYVADDPVYFSKYKAYMKTFKDNVFTESTMNALIDKYQTLISSSVIGTSGEKTQYTYITSESSFNSAFSSLKSHVVARRSLVTTFVQ